MGRGKPVKIIDIDETGESFKLDERALQKVFLEVPDHLPVSLVSVVGAFRTGKSFLLDFLLKYLKNTSGKRDLDIDFEEDPDMSWMTKGGELLEGNKNKMKGDKKAVSKGGFGWRHGSDRCTTGIWIWDEWFKRVVPSTGQEVAVFILDTQGMYDSKTGQHLTASIFGLGTLLSSYTVYNLMFQIQEDHLQHLALFSEYGRLAAANSGEDDETGEVIKPFQKLEFLVRDFSKFDDLDEPLPVIRESFEEYLDTVLSSKYQKDLAEVRDQIELCYQEVSCYCLPHPGTEVSEKKTYDGNINNVRYEFRRLLGDYIRIIFTKRLAPKKINGREVSAQQLFHFVKIYCKLFQEAKIFPEAKTLLQATQEANNLSAIVKAVQEYKHVMDKKLGPGSNYMTDEALNKLHKKAREAAVDAFKSVASLGSKAAIDEAEKKLKKELKEAYNVYRETNRLRDPFAFVAPYVIPIAIALFAYVARYVLETVCPRRSFTCLDFADFFGSLYLITFTFLLAHMISTGYGVRSRMGALLSIPGNK